MTSVSLNLKAYLRRKLDTYMYLMVIYHIDMFFTHKMLFQLHKSTDNKDNIYIYKPKLSLEPF